MLNSAVKTATVALHVQTFRRMERIVFLFLGVLLIGVWFFGKLAFHVHNGFINAFLFIGVLALMVHFAMPRRMT